MDGGIHQSQMRFDIRAEREESERLFKEAYTRRLLYQARVLGWGNEKRYYFANQK